MRHRTLAPAAAATNPNSHLGAAGPQFTDAPVDRAAGETGGYRHRADTAAAARQRLIGREQFDGRARREELRRLSIAGSDLRDINHTAPLARQSRVASRQSVILFLRSC